MIKWEERREYVGGHQAGILQIVYYLNIYHTTCLHVYAKIVEHLVDDSYCPLQQLKYDVIVNNKYISSHSLLTEAKEHAELELGVFFLNVGNALEAWEVYRAIDGEG